MSLQISIRQEREVNYIVTLNGRLDTQTHLLCEQQIEPLINRPIALILDLKALDYISSMGLRVILKARKALEAHKGRLLLVNLQPQIKRVIEIANALPKQNIFASVAEADAYFDVMQRKALEEERDAGKKPKNPAK
jgi:anti-anti-sigma factor